VVDVGELRELGYWGEVLTTAALSRGISGLVIDGGVRDVVALQAHDFPVFSTTIALRGATKNRPGSIGTAVRVGDVAVEPGDWVVGDADGVVIVPGAALEAVLAAGRERAAKEDGFFRELRDGATTLDLLGLDAGLIEGAEQQGTPEGS
jgi:4-hydroxy-4-methyl-2-oxoglutarate aldolase